LDQKGREQVAGKSIVGCGEEVSFHSPIAERNLGPRRAGVVGSHGGKIGKEIDLTWAEGIKTYGKTAA